MSLAESGFGGHVKVVTRADRLAFPTLPLQVTPPDLLISSRLHTSAVQRSHCRPTLFSWRRDGPLFRGMASAVP